MAISSVASSTTLLASKAVRTGCSNILYRIQELVCRINRQLSLLAEQTGQRSQTMKKEYRVSSANAANLQKRIGNVSLTSSTVNVIVMLSAGIAGRYCSSEIQTVLQRGASEFFPQIVKGSADWYSSLLSSEQSREQANYSLRQTELGNEAQKSGEARDLQSELQQILNNLRDLFRKASS